jgi:hypothetical protein
MSKRNYNKKSEYWDKFADPIKNLVIGESQAAFSPDLLGDPFYVSSASYSTTSLASSRGLSSPTTQTRVNRSAVSDTIDRFSSIRKGLLPYNYASDGVNVREAIELCQKAYANVAIFRNAIDIMSEFANTEIFLEGGTQKSRDFFYDWLKKINIWNLKDQYFREYYRSGNVFLYRVDGSFTIADFMKLTSSGTPQDKFVNKIPVRYIILNPFDVVAKRTSTFAVGAYEKILSEYEMSRLQNPATEEDLEIFNGLPKDVQDSIKKGQYYKDGLKIKIDPLKLSYSFYKKQDYEPFAIPFGYPVLEDINAKLELKKMDQAITRTVENVILLITMGTEPEKGGINPQNLNAMQNLFRNESVGRVLVSDYTTKADFVIPDINKVLGPEKYSILNEDIKQGLQNIVVGEEKYSATEVKAQIFSDRLKESRYAFLNDFLQKEIKRIASDLGFRSYPTASFKDLDMRDETQLMRVSTRLMELGVITPQQGMDMFHNGQFPKSNEIVPAQEFFVEERKKGFYNPIVGGVPTISPPDIAPKNGSKNLTNKVAGRPIGTTGIPIVKATFSRKDIQRVIGEIEKMRASAKNDLKSSLNIKKFNKNQELMLDKLCEAIICSTSIEKWGEEINSCVKDSENINNLGLIAEISTISDNHQLDTYSSAILYHSQQNEN